MLRSHSSPQDHDAHLYTPVLPDPPARPKTPVRPAQTPSTGRPSETPPKRRPPIPPRPASFNHNRPEPVMPPLPARRCFSTCSSMSDANHRWLSADCAEPLELHTVDQDPVRRLDWLVQQVRGAVRLYQELVFLRGTTLMNLITELHCIADHLDKTVKKTRVVGITGGTTGAIGTAAIVAGIVLAPATFGASLAMTGLGVGVAAAGGVTGASAVLCKRVKKSQERRKVEKILSSYRSQVKELDECVMLIMSGMEKLRRSDLSGLELGGEAELVLRLAEQVEMCDSRCGVEDSAGVKKATASELDHFFSEDEEQKVKSEAESSFAAKVREVAEKLKQHMDELIRLKNLLR